MAPMILGYWDCRGLVQPIRYLLEHVGQEYEYKCYTFGNDIDTMFSSWFSEKPIIDLDFPNIPYLIDGDIRITESVAILHYLGKKYGLVATNDHDQRTQDMFDGLLTDLASAGTLFYYPDRRSQLYPKDFEAAKKKFLDQRLGPKLKVMNRWMETKRYIFGDAMYYNDFVMFERLDEHSAAFPGLLAQYRSLSRHHELMLNQKGVKDLLSSGRSSKAFRAPMAVCGLAGDHQVYWNEETRTYQKDPKK